MTSRDQKGKPSRVDKLTAFTSDISEIELETLRSLVALDNGERLASLGRDERVSDLHDVPHLRAGQTESQS